MKKYLFPLILLAMPQTAIADNLPVNFIELQSGRVINLDYLWGKGIAPIAPIPQPQTKPVLTDLEQSYITRETRANKQRVAFENANSQIMIELLKNSR